MGKLLEKAASPEVLNAAWRRFRNDKAIWDIGMPRQEMEWNIGFHILKLAEDLRTGTYRPGPVRFFPVNKGNGKQRIISASTLRDKVAQRAALSVIEPIGESFFHQDSYGYRPGRTIDMAISRAREYVLCGMEWVVDADILKYFDNIPHKPLIKQIKHHIPDRDLVNLIVRFLSSGTVRRGFLSRTKGIPQGAVLSPFLCNLYLTEWDRDMASRNLPFVRFADDFLVFAKDRISAEKAHAYVEKALARLDLKLNARKTRVAKCGPKVKFLGRRLPKMKKKMYKGRSL